MNDADIRHENTIREQLTDLETSLAQARLKVKRVTRQRRTYLIITVIALIPISLNISGYIEVGRWLLIIAGIVAFMFLMAVFGSDAEQPRADVERFESIRRLYFDFLNIRDEGEEAYFDRLVKINVENLSEYYSLVKIHTRQSFRLSSAVATIGFILITGGLVADYGNQHQRDIKFLASAAGIVVELIAGVFFYLYSKTVRQLKDYHDSLIDVQNILLSFKLIEGTSDEKERSAMTQRMIEFLAQRRSPARVT